MKKKQRVLFTKAKPLSKIKPISDELNLYHTNITSKRSGKTVDLLIDEISKGSYNPSTLTCGLKTDYPLHWLQAFELFFDPALFTFSWFNFLDDSGKVFESQIHLYCTSNQKSLTVHIYLSTGVVLIKGKGYSEWVSAYFHEIKKIYNDILISHKTNLMDATNNFQSSAVAASTTDFTIAQASDVIPLSCISVINPSTIEISMNSVIDPAASLTNTTQFNPIPPLVTKSQDLHSSDETPSPELISNSNIFTDTDSCVPDSLDFSPSNGIEKDIVTYTAIEPFLTCTMPPSLPSVKYTTLSELKTPSIVCPSNSRAYSHQKSACNYTSQSASSCATFSTSSPVTRTSYVNTSVNIVISHPTHTFVPNPNSPCNKHSTPKTKTVFSSKILVPAPKPKTTPKVFDNFCPSLTDCRSPPAKEVNKGHEVSLPSHINLNADPCLSVSDEIKAIWYETKRNKAALDTIQNGIQNVTSQLSGIKSTINTTSLECEKSVNKLETIMDKKISAMTDILKENYESKLKKIEDKLIQKINDEYQNAKEKIGQFKITFTEELNSVKYREICKRASTCQATQKTALDHLG